MRKLVPAAIFVLTIILMMPVKAVEFNPQIPVNEYWDFTGDSFVSKNKKLGNYRIYVNNTDKNVIYALDDSGKVAWEIWGKDYRFEKFDIRLINNHLVISTQTGYGGVDVRTGGLKNSILKLWVFDQNGKLNWQKKINGSANLPQMVSLDERTFALQTSLSFQKKCAGCTFFNKTWLLKSIAAYDIESGKLVWKYANNYYGNYLEVKNNELISRSGGVGAGQFAHTYTFNIKTGALEKHVATVSDRGYSENKDVELIYDFFKKTIQLNKVFSTTTYWALGSGSQLSALVQKSLDGNLRITTGKEQLIAQGPGTSNTLYAFDEKNGKFLWKRKLAGMDGYVSDMGYREYGNTLIFSFDYITKCKNYCAEVAVCTINARKEKAKQDCLAGEKKKNGYSFQKIAALDAETGTIKWVYRSGIYQFRNAEFKLNDEKNALSFPLYNGSYEKGNILLDLNSGIELP